MQTKPESKEVMDDSNAAIGFVPSKSLEDILLEERPVIRSRGDPQILRNKDKYFNEILYGLRSEIKQVILACGLSPSQKRSSGEVCRAYKKIAGNYSSGENSGNTIMWHLNRFPKDFVEKVTEGNKVFWKYTDAGAEYLFPAAVFAIDWVAQNKMSLYQVLAAKRPMESKDDLRRAITIVKLSQSAGRKWKPKELARELGRSVDGIKDEFLPTLEQAGLILIKSTPYKNHNNYSWNASYQWIPGSAPKDAKEDGKIGKCYRTLKGEIVDLLSSSPRSFSMSEIKAALDYRHIGNVTNVLSDLRNKGYLVRKRGYNVSFSLTPKIKSVGRMFVKISDSLSNEDLRKDMLSRANNLEEKARVALITYHSQFNQKKLTSS